MSSEERSIGGGSVSNEEYDRRAEIVYRNIKENVQQIANRIKNCSEILQDVAKDMDMVSKRITVIQEHSLVTKNATLPEDAVSQDK